MKICPVGAQFYADRQTDRHEGANSRFWKFLRRRVKIISRRLYLFKFVVREIIHTNYDVTNIPAPLYTTRY
jgi:hypothetical protein